MTRYQIDVLLVNIDAATAAALSSFFEQCGLPVQPAIDTASQLERCLNAFECGIIFLGLQRNSEAVPALKDRLQVARRRGTCEIVAVADALDETAMRAALQLQVAEVLSVPIDRNALMKVFQQLYRQLSTESRSRHLQSYVAESLKLISSISLSFGRAPEYGVTEAALNLSLLASDGHPPSESRGGEGEAERSRLMILEWFTALAKTRRKVFGDTFSDPGWDIILDLYRHSLNGGAISVTSACLAAAVPSSTAMRRIAQLEEAGMVCRVKDSRDGRRVLIDLTPSCRKQLDEYFAVARTMLLGGAERRRGKPAPRGADLAAGVSRA